MVDGLDSRSLVPLLNGNSANWDNETVSHYGGTHLGHEASFDRYENLMIKRDHLKYQYYGRDMPEVLFDLSRNPDETIDYAGDPDYAGALANFAGVETNWVMDRMRPRIIETQAISLGLLLGKA